jgi:NAD(P)-dependent dehydrogenase (short-subunit alcohol dehydrogenase family)
MHAESITANQTVTNLSVSCVIRLHILLLQVWQLDLLDTNSVRSFAKAFLNKYSKLDILVNNAGVSEPGITKV